MLSKLWCFFRNGQQFLHPPPLSRRSLLLSCPRMGIRACLFVFPPPPLPLFARCVEDDARWTVKHIEDGGNRFHSGSGRSSPAAWRGHGKQVACRQGGWRRLAKRSGRDSSFERTIGLPALPVSGIRYLISIFEGEGGGEGRFCRGI